MTSSTAQNKAFTRRLSSYFVCAIFSIPSVFAASGSTASDRVILSELDGSVWIQGQHPLPRRLNIPDSIQSICSGTAHFLALSRTGNVWAWGDNSTGQLGTGNTAPATKPIHMSLPPVVAIACGSYHSLALVQNGTIWAWGSNTMGQIGNGKVGAFEMTTTPQQAQHLSGSMAIAAGSRYSLALMPDGHVWTWGNAYIPLPTQITGLGDIRSIRVASDTPLALDKEGGAHTWTSVKHLASQPTINKGASTSHPEFAIAAADSSLILQKALATIQLINGKLTLDREPLEKVVVTANGTPCGESDEAGRYACFLPLNWKGELSATLPGYRFKAGPYQNMDSGEIVLNFTARKPPASGAERIVSGYTTPDTTIYGEGALCTNVTGEFSCSVPDNWSGALRASIDGVRYAGKHFSNVTTNLSGLRFTPPAAPAPAKRDAPPAKLVSSVESSKMSRPATSQPSTDTRTESPVRTSTQETAPPAHPKTVFFKIHGTLTEGGVRAVANASITGADCTTSDKAGNYSCIVPENWSGIILPHKRNTRFYPTSRSYSNLLQDSNYQDFNAAFEPN
ncbi:MAG: hypothetical protein Q7V63_09265 [Gammaproteobacteria bacterium]|nr:hypothetical protein [Gammaproteobacteria bacterium]